MLPKVLDTILGSKSGTDGTVAYDTRIRPQVTIQSHPKFVNPYRHRLESVTCPVKIGIHNNNPIKSITLLPSNIKEHSIFSNVAVKVTTNITQNTF